MRIFKLASNIDASCDAGCAVMYKCGYTVHTGRDYLHVLATGNPFRHVVRRRLCCGAVPGCQRPNPILLCRRPFASATASGVVVGEPR